MKRPTSKIKACRWCGEEFESYAGWVYCSGVCRRNKEQARNKATMAKRKAGRLSGRWMVMERDDFRCGYCGKTSEDGTELQVDHVWPRMLDGEDTFGNVLTACTDCNKGKSARPISERHLNRFLRLVADRNEAAGIDNDKPYQMGTNNVQEENEANESQNTGAR